MKKPRLALTILILPVCLALSWGAYSQGKDALKLSVQSGKAPLTVSIKGPASLIGRAQGQTLQPWVGCGYVVDWGDETYTPSGPMGSECLLGLSHTYDQAGNYTVTARITRPGADDSPVTLWSSSANIVVK